MHQPRERRGRQIIIEQRIKDTFKGWRTNYSLRYLCLLVVTNEPAHLTVAAGGAPAAVVRALISRATIVVKLIADASAIAAHTLSPDVLCRHLRSTARLSGCRSRGPPGNAGDREQPARGGLRGAEDRSAVCVIVECRDVLARSGIMPVVREFAMNEAAARGNFFMHASCFVSNGAARRRCGAAQLRKDNRARLRLPLCRR